MNPKVLIDAILRQTMVLVAQLSTNAGLRAPLANVTNKVFLDLVTELEDKGVARKVIADMFGLALRSYQLKVQRVSDAVLEDNHSLWEEIHDFLPEDDLISRREIMKKFKYSDAASVRSILNDLVESGLVLKTGRGDGTMYCATSTAELGRAHAADPVGTAMAVTWITVYRNRRISRVRLEETIALPDDDVEAALERLVGEGRIHRVDTDDDTFYESATCVIPMGQGWEAAVFDHFQAVVSALVCKLSQGRSLPQDIVGGSTYSFDVWAGHPHENAVLGLLREMRGQVSRLRAAVTAHNAEVERPDDGVTKVTFYVGQHVDLDGDHTWLSSEDAAPKP